MGLDILGRTNRSSLDPYGHSLWCARLPGDKWRKAHDEVLWTIDKLARECKFDLDPEVLGLFAPYIMQHEHTSALSPRQNP